MQWVVHKNMRWQPPNKPVSQNSLIEARASGIHRSSYLHLLRRRNQLMELLISWQYLIRHSKPELGLHSVDLPSKRTESTLLLD